MEIESASRWGNLNLSHPGIRWTLFEQIDQLRRLQGKLLGGLGWGPSESPSRIVFTEPALTLRAYAGARTASPAVLIIPAPIKRAYIWDLAPDASVIQQFVRSGFGVYLAQWEEPGVDQQQYGLAEYADGLIRDSLRAIQREGGSRQVFLAGHSLGGTLAAIFSALHPRRIAGLILVAAPLHFGPEVDSLSNLVAASPLVCPRATISGEVPGSVLDLASILAAPATFVYSRWLDWLASLPNAETLCTHLQVERWTHDELPLARRFFQEVVEWLYREDRLMRGTLELSGRRVRPDLVESPLLSVVERHSEVAPPEAVRPFYRAVRSRQKQWLWYDGDVGVCLKHVGMLVGKTAHQSLWPEVIRWARRQSRQTFPPWLGATARPRRNRMEAGPARSP